MAALDWLAENFTKRYGVVAAVRLERLEPGESGESDGPVFNDFASTTLFRIVQEALTNVARHASASRVRIDMACAEETFLLEIEDDGIGAALEGALGKNSFGLLGIRERVRQLHGSVSFFSAPGSGFRISIRTPIDALE
ncbi:sensor histidine kinase [Paraburkholderia diazotrophica]|uniref:sensor histidine kinase n=1 Tax=Paraburkholderia diazotrophica TaxID=667676 RepID=UPI0031829A9B